MVNSLQRMINTVEETKARLRQSSKQRRTTVTDLFGIDYSDTIDNTNSNAIKPEAHFPLTISGELDRFHRWFFKVIVQNEATTAGTSVTGTSAGGQGGKLAKALQIALEQESLDNIWYSQSMRGQSDGNGGTYHDCSSFVCWCLAQAGVDGVLGGSTVSMLTWSNAFGQSGGIFKEVDLNTAKAGTILVWGGLGGAGNAGHTAFLTEDYSPNAICVECSSYGEGTGVGIDSVKKVRTVTQLNSFMYNTTPVALVLANDETAYVSEEGSANTSVNVSGSVGSDAKSWASSVKAYFIGDSLGVGAQSKLSQYFSSSTQDNTSCINVTSDTCGKTSENGLVKAGRVPSGTDVVVIALGTNGIKQGDVKAMLNALNNKAKSIIWVNSSANHMAGGAIDTIVNSEGQGKVKLLDWASYSSGSWAGWHSGDGTHMNSAGIEAYTNFLVEGIYQIVGQGSSGATDVTDAPTGTGSYTASDITYAGHTLSADNLNKILSYCVSRNLLPSGVICQLYLESWWGDSPVAKADNNWSGMTGGAQTRPSGVVVTTGTARPANEGGTYMHYASVDDFFNDYTYLISAENGTYGVAGKQDINSYTEGLFTQGGAVADYAASGYAHYLPLMLSIRNGVNQSNSNILDELDELWKSGQLSVGGGDGNVVSGTYSGGGIAMPLTDVHMRVNAKNSKSGQTAEIDLTPMLKQIWGCDWIGNDFVEERIYPNDNPLEGYDMMFCAWYMNRRERKALFSAGEKAFTISGYGKAKVTLRLYLKFSHID